MKEPNTSPVIVPPPATSCAITPTAGVNTVDTIAVTAATATTFAIFLAIGPLPLPFAFSSSTTASNDLLSPFLKDGVFPNAVLRYLLCFSPDNSLMQAWLFNRFDNKGLQCLSPLPYGLFPSYRDSKSIWNYYFFSLFQELEFIFKLFN